MAYRFRASDRSVQHAVRRIAREQIDGALAAIGGNHVDIATHEVRKACKKLRALIRLVRPGFADYRAENAEFRDIARLLSGTRDAKVMLDTFDLLLADAATAGDAAIFAPVRADFVRDLSRYSQGNGSAGPFAQVRARLQAARKRIDGWRLEEDWEVLGTGLRRILRRARKAARAVMTDPTALSHHQLRKAMKYHWYHARLLAPIWPATMQPRVAELGRLADVLGLHHDLSVLEERLGGALPHGDRRKAAVALLSRAAARRAALERECRLLVARLLAERPRALARRWHALWRIWRGEWPGG